MLKFNLVNSNQILRGNMKKKILLLVCLIVAIGVAFTGCASTVRLSDVYVNHATLTEFDGANREGEIPAGYDVAYNAVSNPFFSGKPWVVVTKNSAYAVYDYKNQTWVIGGVNGDKETLFKEIKKTDKFIFYKESSSSNVQVLACDSQKGIQFKKNTTQINNVVTLSNDGNYFAYKNNKVVEFYGQNGYLTQIYNLNGNLYLYDNYVVATNASSVSSVSKVEIYKLPSVMDDNTESITNPEKNAIFEGTSLYPSYLGGGRFYIFSQTRASGTEYQYTLNGKNYNGEAIIYNANTEKIEKSSKSNTYFMSILFDENEQLTNEYGDLVVSINDVLKKGYKLVQSGITVDPNTKTAYSDQYILDQNNEIVTSLTGRVGNDFQLNQDRLSGFSPLYMLFIDGKGFSPNNSWGYIRLLNIDGSTAFEKTDATYKNLFYNDGTLVCQKLIQSNKTLYSNARFGAYDRNGRTIVDFTYDYIAPFIDGVALAYNIHLEDYPEIRLSDIYNQNGKWYKPNGELLTNKDKPDEEFDPQNAKKIYKVYKLDKDANATPIDDFTMTKRYQLIFKTGAYVCKNADGTYNVKTISGSKLFNEDFTDVVINKPNLDDVTICGKVKDGKTIIYTLTSSTRGLPRATTINDVIVPVVIISSITLASIVMLVVLKVKNVSNKPQNEVIINKPSKKEKKK